MGIIALIVALAAVGPVPGGVGQGDAAAAQGTRPVEFAAGDPAALEVRVVSAAEVVEDHPWSLVELEVQNGGALVAEPLVFRFTPRRAPDAPPPERTSRVDFPHYGRAGRPTAVGKGQRYWVLVPYRAQIAEGARVAVEVASFPVAELALEAPVRVRSRANESTFDGELGRTMPRARIVLENTSPYELDAVFRARFEEPARAESLVEFHLLPGETREFLVDEMPVARDASWLGAEISRLELVDWCAQLSDGEELASELFTRAYDRWLRLPDDFPGLRGRFAFDHSSREGVLEASGIFLVTADGEVHLPPDQSLSDAARGHALRALERAFEMLHRPAADEVLAATSIAMLSGGESSVVRLDEALFQSNQRDLHLALRGDTVVWAGLSPAPESSTHWTTRELGDGYVVIAREQRVTWQERPVESERFGHQRFGELILPTSYDYRWGFDNTPDSERHSHLVLSEHAVGVELAESRRPPEGELADQLRAAWGAVYRYPEPQAGEEFELSGRFAVEHPGTDALWLGQRTVEGEFTLHGFRGTRWRDYTIEVSGRSLSPQTARQLGEVVEDRLRMFAGRDFGGRPSFDQAFAGARLSAVQGAIGIENASFSRVEVRDGRPALLELSGGAQRSFQYSKVGRDFVPSVIRTGPEELRATWTSAGEGWLFPKKMVLSGVWPDWGPEELRLSKLSVRRVSPATGQR